MTGTDQLKRRRSGSNPRAWALAQIGFSRATGFARSKSLAALVINLDCIGGYRNHIIDLGLVDPASRFCRDCPVGCRESRDESDEMN